MCRERIQYRSEYGMISMRGMTAFGAAGARKFPLHIQIVFGMYRKEDPISLFTGGGGVEGTNRIRLDVRVPGEFYRKRV